ncbi:MAG: hypothetical protein GEV11_15625 [Streptosporangiales bacterium]|nr:hypothetical protein [Streptosporangiales bacterium]
MTTAWVGDGSISPARVQREKSYLRDLAIQLEALAIGAKVVGMTDVLMRPGAHGATLRRPPTLHVWTKSDDSPQRLTVRIRDGRSVAYVWGDPEQAVPVKSPNEAAAAVAAALDVTTFE